MSTTKHCIVSGCVQRTAGNDNKIQRPSYTPHFQREESTKTSGSSLFPAENIPLPERLRINFDFQPHRTDQM